MNLNLTKEQNKTMWVAYSMGFVGVIVFSGTLAATKVAINHGVAPVDVVLIRISFASLLASALLYGKSVPFPSKHNWKKLLTVALGVVIGFPFFSSLALEKSSASSASIVSGGLPFITAFFATLSTGQKQSSTFWGASISACLVITWYMVQLHGMKLDSSTVYMLLAVLCGGIGYAFGGQLAMKIPGWQVISWSLLPAGFVAGVCLIISSLVGRKILQNYSWQAWLAIGYISLLSQYIGFFFWYEGLARGGIAKVSQLQSFQTLFSVAIATWIAGEHISQTVIWVALILVSCIFISVRSKSYI